MEEVHEQYDLAEETTQQQPLVVDMIQFYASPF